MADKALSQTVPKKIAKSVGGEHERRKPRAWQKKKHPPDRAPEDRDQDTHITKKPVI